MIVLGGRDPETHWKRKWDGYWRMFIFDLPAKRVALRRRLLRWLRNRGFGFLQNSVWIHTDPVSDVTEALKDFREDVESFTIMESRCAFGFSNAAIVQGAWYFDEIEKRQHGYLSVIDRCLVTLRRDEVTPPEAFRLVREERDAWEHAMELDPLLPQTLLPRNYLGCQAWEKRKQFLHRLAKIPG